MRPTLATHLLFACGLVVLAAANSMVLTGVEENRRGTPDAVPWLTERELPMVDHLAMENSGMTLRLVWRCLGSGDTEVNDRWPSWLTAEKSRIGSYGRSR